MVFNIHPCDAPPMISVLDGVVSSGVMMLLNAGDVGAAIEAVSCVKVDTQVSLIEVVTGEFQKSFITLTLLIKLLWSIIILAIRQEIKVWKSIKKKLLNSKVKLVIFVSA